MHIIFLNIKLRQSPVSYYTGPILSLVDKENKDKLQTYQLHIQTDVTFIALMFGSSIFQSLL